MTKHPDSLSRTCTEVPEFERLNFFYGQMLGAADFRSEQAYFREKLKLHNRCLHGYGVVCGLEVTPVATGTSCEPADAGQIEELRKRLAEADREIEAIRGKLAVTDLPEEERAALEKMLADATVKREVVVRMIEEAGATVNPDGSPDCKDRGPEAKVVIQCGLGIDCEGNEIVLRAPLAVDLWALLAPLERQRLREAGGGIVYLAVCYCGEPINPTRPAIPDSCGALSECTFGKTRDSLRFSVTTEAPEVDERCETCCAGCGCECLLLAAIALDEHGTITDGGIDNAVRRPIGPYIATTITGVSWEHGRTYSPGEAKTVLGTEVDNGGRSDGIEIAFSRPVYAETLAPGVIDIWRVQGGRGLRGMISSIEGAYFDKPDKGLISSVRYRDESGETLNSGDRLLIIVRGDFILDACCRALDGNHVGGRVPQLEAYRDVNDETKQQPDKGSCEGGADGPCLLPPGGIGPWKSGNGSPGGTFESWIYID